MPWLTFFDTGYIKHRDNPFCGIDSECNSISFLLDSNTAASTVNYINANSEIGNKVLCGQEKKHIGIVIEYL